jgi:hypothetical protein
VNVDDFDARALRTWLEGQVLSAHGTSWNELAERLSRLGRWEFEDYRDGHWRSSMAGLALDRVCSGASSWCVGQDHGLPGKEER